MLNANGRGDLNRIQRVQVQRYLSRSKGSQMTTMEKKTTDDPDIHKGAIEGDRPSDEQNVDRRGTGIDPNGLPNDPKATAEDREGANADQTQG